MKILLGEDASRFLNRLGDKDINWDSRKIDENVKGGIMTTHIIGVTVYTAFSCCGNETFVEDFDDVVEAAKYANGIIAKTREGYKI